MEKINRAGIEYENVGQHDFPLLGSCDPNGQLNFDIYDAKIL